jgi:hypothetical protein
MHELKRASLMNNSFRIHVCSLKHMRFRTTMEPQIRCWINHLESNSLRQSTLAQIANFEWPDIKHKKIELTAIKPHNEAATIELF